MTATNPAVSGQATPELQTQQRARHSAIIQQEVVGMVIGLIVELLGWLLCKLEWKGIFYPCFMTILPIFITGGIHMDGFLDTMDGISSYQTKERRLEILKDSNSGAFAIIGGLVYMILSIGAWSEVSVKSLPVIACSYCLSRAISILLALSQILDASCCLFIFLSSYNFYISINCYYDLLLKLFYYIMTMLKKIVILSNIISATLRPGLASQ